MDLPPGLCCRLRHIVEWIRLGFGLLGLLVDLFGYPRLLPTLGAEERLSRPEHGLSDRLAAVGGPHQILCDLELELIVLDDLCEEHRLVDLVLLQRRWNPGQLPDYCELRASRCTTGRELLQRKKLFSRVNWAFYVLLVKEIA